MKIYAFLFSLLVLFFFFNNGLSFGIHDTDPNFWKSLHRGYGLEEYQRDFEKFDNNREMWYERKIREDEENFNEIIRNQREHDFMRSIRLQECLSNCNYLPIEQRNQCMMNCESIYGY